MTEPTVSITVVKDYGQISETPPRRGVSLRVTVYNVTEEPFISEVLWEGDYDEAAIEPWRSWLEHEAIEMAKLQKGTERPAKESA